MFSSQLVPNLILYTIFELIYTLVLVRKIVQIEYTQTIETKLCEKGKMIRAHIFSPLQPEAFYRQAPGSNSTVDGVKFTVGLDVPENIDVLLVVGRGSFSIPTKLPRERTVFCEVEPDAVNPRNSRFLNQFGIVVTSSEQQLTTEKWQQSNFSGWFVGMEFAEKGINYQKGYDWFKKLNPQTKMDKISIVTSNKNRKKRPFYEKRLKFIKELQEIIPEHLEIYGRGFRSVGDKAEVLLPYKYHLALENCTGKYTWTEKIADPLLCWSYPFYFGCTNMEEDIPSNSFTYVDIHDPQGSAEIIVNAIKNQLWEKSLSSIEEARNLMLNKHNIIFRFTELAKIIMNNTVPEWPKKQRLIRSDRSLRPDGFGKGTVFDWLLRSSLILFDPKIELRLSGLHYWYMNERHKRRKRKLIQDEKHLQVPVE